jgi:hypothetical protein
MAIPSELENLLTPGDRELIRKVQERLREDPPGKPSAAADCVRIPLLPLRYSVHPRPPNPACTYVGKGLPLETGFNALNWMQYDVRRVGGGFVYLFDETRGDVFVWRVNENGSFSELKSSSKTIGAALKNYQEKGILSWIGARAESTVHLVLTDTLLTENKVTAIQTNRDGIRDKLATTIDIPAWNTASPAKNTFSAERLGELVEEDRPGGCDLSFSPQQLTGGRKTAGELSSGMKKIASKQIAVVLHDPIALVQDMGGLIVRAQEALERYTFGLEESDAANMTRYRKKVAAELIEHVYSNAYAADKGIADPAAVGKAIQKDVDRLRKLESIEQREASRAHRGGPSHGADGRPRGAAPSDPQELRSQALATRAERYVRHVREDERVAFLKRYDADIKRLQMELTHYKNDRCAWLKDYFKSDQASSFGSAFLRYETDASPCPEQEESGAFSAAEIDRSTSSSAHALAFSTCVEGMMWGVETLPDGSEDRERKLIDHWWRGQPEANPFLLNMAYDRGFAGLWNASGAASATGAVSVVAGPTLTYAAALERLMEQSTVYLVSSFVDRAQSSRRNLQGPVWQALAGRIRELANGVDPDNVGSLFEILRRDKHRDRITQVRITLREAARGLEDAAGLRRGTLAVDHGDDLIMVYSWREAEWDIHSRYYLPVVEGGLTGAAALLAFVNLWTTLRAFETDGWSNKTGINVFNLFSAVLGVGSAINAGLAVTRARLPGLLERFAPQHELILRQLSGITALRLFGYGAALADAITHWFKAYKQFSLGNATAGHYYAVSGLFLGLGGAAVTHAAVLATTAAAAGAFGTAAALVPVAGWTVAGIVLLGAGTYTVFLAKEAEYTEIEYWLNDCVFGRHVEFPGTARAAYTVAGEEILGFFRAYYAPRLVEENWERIDPDKTPVRHAALAARRKQSVQSVLTLRLLYPLEGEIHPPAAGAVSGKPPRCAEAASSGPQRTYHVFDLKDQAPGFRYSLTFSYTPSVLGESLPTTYPVDPEKAPWGW